MSKYSQDAMETYMSITGASDAIALQKLEEYGWDVNEAVNAHFNEGDRTMASAIPCLVPQNDLMNLDDPLDFDYQIPVHPLLSAAQSLNPFMITNSSIGQRIVDGGATEFVTHAPRVSHPREVGEASVEFSAGNGSASFIRGPIIEEVTGNVPENVPENHENPIIEYEDQGLPSDHVDHRYYEFNNGLRRHTGKSVTPLDYISDYDSDIEEEMIQAAIEASKQTAKAYATQKFDIQNGSSDPKLNKASPAVEDADIAHAVSLSLKTAEQENALRELGLPIGQQSSHSLGIDLEDVERVRPANGRRGLVTPTRASGKSIAEEGSSSIQGAADAYEKPLSGHRSRQIVSENAESAGVIQSTPNPDEHDIAHREPNGHIFQSNEWGGISSMEHDEAVMLEAAIFGRIPQGDAYNSTYPLSHLQSGYQNTNLYPGVPHQPAPSLTAQRLLREKQDDEYPTALQADREKELKAVEEAERSRLEEVAALGEEKHREEETCRKLVAEEEFERIIAAKQASLPDEPSSDDENAVTLQICMPNRSRRGRRFLKSDKLQFIFDYIDIGRVVKPGTYRLVRPYPRHAFADGECTLALSELGLTSKQEALLLELI